MGDLDRYVSLLEDSTDCERAKERYANAQLLAPKNGKSYHQLAVVAVQTKNKLDALYYYARAIQASNPVLTARDRLVDVLQELKKKVKVVFITRSCICTS